MRQEFTIPGRLDGLNEYTKACRSNHRAGARMKKDNQEAVQWAIRAARINPMSGKVNVKVTWYERDMRRDKDNIRFGVKFILDALVAEGIIKNDSWTYIGELRDEYYCSKPNPRVVVELEEA